jgi:hypothetical protein
MEVIVVATDPPPYIYILFNLYIHVNFLLKKFSFNFLTPSIALIEFSGKIDGIYHGKEVRLVKRPISPEVKEREAAFWNRVKKALKDSPAKTCRK